MNESSPVGVPHQPGGPSASDTGPSEARSADRRAGGGAPNMVIARGQKAQKIAYIAAAAIVLVFTGVAFTLRGKTESGKSVFHVEDQIAMIILGLLCGAAILMFTRPRIIASADGIRLRNLLGWIDVPWEIVTAVRFDRGSPWVSLDLRDDDVIGVMAVQAADKEYAVATVRALRRLLAASREPVSIP